MKYESVSCLIMQFEFFHFFSLFCVSYSYVYFVTYWSSKAIIYKEQQKRWTKSFWFSVPMSFKTCSKKRSHELLSTSALFALHPQKHVWIKGNHFSDRFIPTSRTTLVATTFQCWNVTFVIIHIKSAKEALTKASLIINYTQAAIFRDQKSIKISMISFSDKNWKMCEKIVVNVGTVQEW